MSAFTLIVVKNETSLTHAEDAGADQASLEITTERDAVSILWDCHTRADLSAADLERYATAKQLFRKKRYELAARELNQSSLQDADSLNLLGAIYESMGKADDAKWCYAKACVADKDCWAASMNARRIYEMNTFGNSSILMYI